ncbi:acyltransferase family protein [Anaerovorax odorimutans]|uniref:acyltransferase family protein n=1 Tax=Anaerovorax odorimutans TaxID=109327 RepID=UPI0004064BFF|nr:acyltransferase family protein [Anaerovorax odorimutans]
MIRNYLFDNLKAILIFFVVFAHYIRVSATFEANTIGGVIYITSFSFIMQGFLFVSGYFSKHVDKCRETAFKSFLFPYFVLMPIMYTIRYFIFGEANFDITLPTMALWYLLNMFVYRYFLKDLINIQYILPISVILSLLSGCIDSIDETLSIARIIGFLPFFLLGYFSKEEHIKKIQQIPKGVGIFVSFILVGFSAILSYFNKIPIDAWYFKSSYNNLGISNIEGIVIRIFISIIALAWIVVFLILVPNKKTKLSYIGKNTMSVYTMHIIIRYIIKGFEIFSGENIVNYLLILLTAALSVWLLSRQIVADTYKSMIDIIYNTLKKFFNLGLFQMKKILQSFTMIN